MDHSSVGEVYYTRKQEITTNRITLQSAYDTDDSSANIIAQILGASVTYEQEQAANNVLKMFSDLMAVWTWKVASHKFNMKNLTSNNIDILKGMDMNLANVEDEQAKVKAACSRANILHAVKSKVAISELNIMKTNYNKQQEAFIGVSTVSPNPVLLSPTLLKKLSPSSAFLPDRPVYCVVILFPALKGVDNAFMQIEASEEQIQKYNVNEESNMRDTPFKVFVFQKGINILFKHITQATIAYIQKKQDEEQVNNSHDMDRLKFYLKVLLQRQARKGGTEEGYKNMVMYSMGCALGCMHTRNVSGLGVVSYLVDGYRTPQGSAEADVVFDPELQLRHFSKSRPVFQQPSAISNILSSSDASTYTGQNNIINQHKNRTYMPFNDNSYRTGYNDALVIINAFVNFTINEVYKRRTERGVTNDKDFAIIEGLKHLLPINITGTNTSPNVLNLVE